MKIVILKSETQIALVGVQFLPDGTLDKLAVSQAVVLQPEPSNAYDPNAVQAVALFTVNGEPVQGELVQGEEYETLPVGYVPAMLARRLSAPEYGGSPDKMWLTRIELFTHHDDRRVGLRVIVEEEISVS